MAPATMVAAQKAGHLTTSVLRCRLMMLPLVCKRWARMLRQPSAIWECGVVDLQVLYDRGEYGFALDNCKVFDWFNR